MSYVVKKFNANQFEFEEVKENERVKGQYISKIKGDWIKEESHRAKLKIPLDENDPKYGSAIKKRLIDPMNALDDMIWEQKEQIMGKHAIKFKDPRTHQRIVKEGRTIEADSDSDDSDNVPQKTLPYMTVKLGLEWTDDGKCTDKLKIKTFRKEEIINEQTGKKESRREELFLDNIDQLEALGIYRSNIRLVIIPSKFYLMPKAYEPKFGLIWKAVQLEIEPSRSVSRGLSFNQDLFADSDSDNEMNKEEESNDDEDDEDDENDEDDEYEKPKKTKKKGKTSKAEV